MMTKTSTRSAYVVLLALALIRPNVALSGPARTVTGHGGFPLSDRVSSMWGVIDEAASDTHKVITFLIYFRGGSGWHQRKWTFDVRTGEEPAVVAFLGEPIVLRAEYSREDAVLSLFGARVPIKRANVLLVDNVDQPGKEKVTELGFLDLRVPQDANPALWVLEQSPAVRKQVVAAASPCPVPGIKAACATVWVTSGGKLELNGQPADLARIDEAFQALVASKGVVVYAREAGRGEPPPAAMKVMELIVKHRLPVSMSTKRDFSDVVGPDGKVTPRKAG